MSSGKKACAPQFLIGQKLVYHRFLCHAESLSGGGQRKKKKKWNESEECTINRKSCRELSIREPLVPAVMDVYKSIPIRTRC